MEMITEFFHGTGSLLLYYILPLVVVLGLMIFFHELGHFLVAKYFNVKVLQFALGFGPRIVAREYGETEYSIRYIPLGGFVKMLGEDVADEDAEKLSPEDEKRAFNRQHVFKRMAIVAAGPLFNMFLALVLFCGMFIVSGDSITTAEVGKVLEDSPAYSAGIKEGDVIISLDGREVEKWDDIRSLIQDKAGRAIPITVQRHGEAVTLSITPEEGTGTNEFGEETKTVQIGIGSAYKSEKVKLNPLQAVVEGTKYTWMWTKLTCLVVVKLFEGVVSVKTLTGPLGIAGITGEIAKENPMNLIPFSAIISINLGILNLFPIPILDGGMILFLIVELIMGRPLSLRKREMAQRIGFSLLIALMILVFYNDILRMFQPTP